MAMVAMVICGLGVIRIWGMQGLFGPRYRQDVLLFFVAAIHMRSRPHPQDITGLLELIIQLNENLLQRVTFSRYRGFPSFIFKRGCQV